MYQGVRWYVRAPDQYFILVWRARLYVEAVAIMISVPVRIIKSKAEESNAVVVILLHSMKTLDHYS